MAEQPISAQLVRSDRVYTLTVAGSVEKSLTAKQGFAMILDMEAYSHQLTVKPLVVRLIMQVGLAEVGEEK